MMNMVKLSSTSNWRRLVALCINAEDMRMRVGFLWIQMSSHSCLASLFTIHMHYLTTYNFGCSFEFRLRISLSKDGDLSLVSRIRNVNGKPFSFSFAYHTYLSVSDIRLGNIYLHDRSSV
jgi:galactose mutarotase-like enzyme